jgi:hypothetical protein
LLVVIIPIAALLVWIMLLRNDPPPVYEASAFHYKPEVVSTFTPDSTLQLNIIRFKPKVSSDRYVVKISIEDSSIEIENDLFQMLPELTVSDYDGNEIGIESPLLLSVRKVGSNSVMDIYMGYYSLSTQKHYRIDFSAMDNYISKLKNHGSGITYSVGVLKIE